MPDCCLLNRIILCLPIKLSLIKLNCKIVNTDLLRKLIEKLKDFTRYKLRGTLLSNLLVSFTMWKVNVISNQSSSVLEQKGESQNWGNKKTNHAKFSKKRTFFTPIGTRTCAYQGVRNNQFLESLACFIFLLLPFCDFLFCLITEEFTSLKMFNPYCPESFQKFCQNKNYL